MNPRFVWPAGFKEGLFYVSAVFVVGLCIGFGSSVIQGQITPEADKEVAYKTIRLLHAEVRRLEQQLGPLPAAEKTDEVDPQARGVESGVDPDLPIAMRTIRLLRLQLQRLRNAHTTKQRSSRQDSSAKEKPPPAPTTAVAASPKSSSGKSVALEGTVRMEAGSLAKDAKELSAAIVAHVKKAMPTEDELPRKTLAHAQDGDADPVSASGRVLWALATHPEINSIVSYYSGAAVYCLAHGLKHKFDKTKVKGKVITAEINHGEYEKLTKILKDEGLAPFVEIKDKGVTAQDPPLCSKAIDLFVEDVTGGDPLWLLADKVFGACSPTYYFSENTAGIGANMAYKHDYQDTIPEDHIAIKDRLSMLAGGKCGAGCEGVQGRAFSLYTRPMPYAKVKHYQYPRDGLLVFYANGPGLEHPKDQPQYRRRSGRDR